MKNLRIPIIFASIYLFFYASIPELGLSLDLMFVLFSLSPIIVVGLVVWVLKKGIPSERTWKEGYFYDDADFMHNVQDEETIMDEIHEV